MIFTKARGCIGIAMLVAGLIATGGRADAADDFHYGVSLGVGHSDNVTRVRDNPTGDTIGTAGFDAGINYLSRRFAANLLTDLQYQEYFDNTYGAQFVGNLVGDARFSIVPERFIWIAQENFGQTAINSLSPTTPDNQENVNYFTTGPQITLRLSSTLDAMLAGSYSNVSYEDSRLGNNRLQESAALRHAFSTASSISLNAVNQHVQFNSNAIGSDYDSREAFIAYNLHGSRSTLEVDLGYTQLRFPGNDSSGILARVHASREISPSSTVTLEAGREFSDAATQFRDLQASSIITTGAVGTGAQPVQELSSPFISTHGILGWNFARNRTSVNASVAYFKDGYQAQSAFDRARALVGLEMQRQLNVSLTASIGGSYGKDKYLQGGETFSDSSARAGLSWRLGRTLFLSFQYQRYRRTDDIAINNYSENQFWLRISYAGGRGGVSQAAGMSR